MRYIQSYNESLFSVRKKMVEELCKKYLSYTTHSSDDYIIKDDLSVDVINECDVSMSNERKHKDSKLKKIPIKFNKVEGIFDCSFNLLTSLDGCPKIVGYEVILNNNLLTSLDGCPVECADLNVENNRLTTLKGWNGSYEISYNNNPIYVLMEKILDSFTDFDEVLWNYHDMKLQKEISDRLEEFEVIKESNRLDIISLNSLFDFYQIPFDEKKFKNIKGYVN